MIGNVYDEDYFIRGKQSGKSLYENYRWLEELTMPMARSIVDHLGIRSKDMILDFGCARGYVVKALRRLGHLAYGYDISEWAIANCDPEVTEYVGTMPTKNKYDWILAKDVLEHVADLETTVGELMPMANKGIFVVVPLGVPSQKCYVVPEYEMDITHIHRLTITNWAQMFIQPGWSVTMSYRMPGVKDNYAQHKKGNGFLVMRRLEE